MAWMYLYYLLELFKWLIIIRAIVSWFVAPYSENPLVQLLRRVTDPILQPIASVIPSAGGFDISPLVAYFVIYLLQQLVAGMMY
jgi:YggT family protein